MPNSGSAVDLNKRKTVSYRDSTGRSRNAQVVSWGTARARTVTIATTGHDVTIRTTSASKAITAASGTFSAADVGAYLTGNNTNVGVGNTIASVQDSTHATLTSNAAATDGTGTATHVTTTTITSSAGFNSDTDVGAAIAAIGGVLAACTITAVTDSSTATVSVHATSVATGQSATVTPLEQHSKVKLRLIDTGTTVDNVARATAPHQTGVYYYV